MQNYFCVLVGNLSQFANFKKLWLRKRPKIWPKKTFSQLKFLNFTVQEYDVNFHEFNYEENRFQAVANYYKEKTKVLKKNFCIHHSDPHRKIFLGGDQYMSVKVEDEKIKK